MRLLHASFLNGMLAVCVPLLMTACVSYQDPLPSAERQAALSSASNILSGEYDVVESRHDRYDGDAQISVRQEGRALVVSFTSAKRAWNVRGIGCRGYDSGGHKFVDVTCGEAGGDVNFISIGQDKNGRTIKDGAILPSFEPMRISGDEYFLQVAMRNGRSYYYRLKRK